MPSDVLLILFVNRTLLRFDSVLIDLAMIVQSSFEERVNYTS